jgi:hypothetical protein
MAVWHGTAARKYFFTKDLRKMPSYPSRRPEHCQSRKIAPLGQISKNNPAIGKITSVRVSNGNYTKVADTRRRRSQRESDIGQS